jgi:hypothetical protein
VISWRNSSRPSGSPVRIIFQKAARCRSRVATGTAGLSAIVSLARASKYARPMGARSAAGSTRMLR